MTDAAWHVMGTLVDTSWNVSLFTHCCIRMEKLLFFMLWFKSDYSVLPWILIWLFGQNIGCNPITVSLHYVIQLSILFSYLISLIIGSVLCVFCRGLKKLAVKTVRDIPPPLPLPPTPSHPPPPILPLYHHHKMLLAWNELQVLE